MQLTTDVAIVGGGPAGLAAALVARQQGLRAAVFEAAAPLIDKACGEGIMPDGVAALGALGVPLSPADGAAFRGIRFLDRGRTAQAAFPRHSGIGMRRTALHAMMIERAAAEGVDLHWGTLVRGMTASQLQLDNGTVSYRWLIGADGQKSQVRAWAGLEPRRPGLRRYGFRRHLRYRVWADFVEVYWHPRCQLYFTPVSADEACVAVISRDPHMRLAAALELFPELQRRLAGAVATTTERGGVSLSRRIRRVARGNVALIGDASGSVDALTGEGLSLAFRQALALGEALARQDLAWYAAEHRRIVRLSRLMSRLLVSMEAFPHFRGRVLAAFAAEPALFPRLLALHVGALAPADFGVRGAASLGWRLISA